MLSKLRVMLCDDSGTVRAALARILESDAAIEIVARVADGSQALRALDSAAAMHRAEVVLLDLEMPVMDGMTVLPRILERKPRPVVIVASALTQKGAAATMAALSAGASDYISKPSAAAGGLNDPVFRADLLAKVKGWARLRDGTARITRPRPAVVRSRPKVVCIGSSTGGPQALATLVRRLPRKPSVPMLLVQHMPAGFTSMLAEHLSGLGGPKVIEAREGDVLEPGVLFLARGDRHLVARQVEDRVILHLSEGPPENYCRPAVDPTLRSLVAVYGGGVLAVILTGMGHDGLAGCRGVSEAGGAVWAQDEASSVVWGMPGAVSRAGLVSEQAPPMVLGDTLADVAGVHS
ncbi:chemotaxis-specific protein-glutamate methyltransferase CheB [Roseococcus sp. YIM B11640]|uniref:chemotaxis-specific protein-glutamate methyltransferase CheB n=1 Tax=Roseococcus sp. YIM B11640 TaxID=3133973 RepID=UPI003C7B74B1